jgi:hypothetical protein
MASGMQGAPRSVASRPHRCCLLRSDPKAAWQGDESCVLMYPVYLRADRGNPPLSPALRDPAQHRHPRVAAGGQPCGIFRASLVSLSLSQSLGSRGPVLVFPRSDFEYQIGSSGWPQSSAKDGRIWAWHSLAPRRPVLLSTAAVAATLPVSAETVRMSATT